MGVYESQWCVRGYRDMQSRLAIYPLAVAVTCKQAIMGAAVLEICSFL